MGKIDVLGKFATAVTAPPFAKHIFKGMFREWSLEGIRAQMEAGSDFETLEEQSPGIALMIHNFASKSPSLRRVEWPEIETWMEEANPDLYRELQEDPELMGWMRLQWESNRNAVT